MSDTDRKEETDHELLRQFVDRADEPAFSKLVHRYLSLVYGTAMRRLGNRSLAEEVTQGVFATLAKKSGSLKQHPCLAGWLQKTAAFQALRAGEKEQTRTRKMREYQESIDGASGGSEIDGDAIGELDAAILTLNETDRQTILLRFYRQLSFKAIGNILGKSAGTCQKQTSRALEKLQATLRKRGVTISATAIATLLTSELSKAAPVGISISATGATQAPASSLAGTKLATICAGVAGIAAVSFIGYSSGRAAGGKIEIPEGEVSQPDQKPVALTAIIKKEDSGVEKRQLLLSEIIRLARAEMREAEFDPAAGRRAIARIGRIPAADIPAALEIVGKLPGGFVTEKKLTDEILKHWATTDGQAACEFSLANRIAGYAQLPVKEPLRVWAMHEPKAAFDWFMKENDRRPEGSNGWDGDFVLRAVISSWVATDIQGALAAAKSVSEIDGLKTGAYWGLFQHSKHLPSRTPILDYFHAKKQPGEKNVGLTDGMDFWGRDRPEEFAEWIDSKKEGELHDSVAGQLFKAWSSVDHEKALAWWLERDRDGEDMAMRKKKLIEVWASGNDGAAGEWLASQPQSPELDGAYAALSELVKPKDPDSAHQFALQITDKKLREETIAFEPKKKPESVMDIVGRARELGQLKELKELGIKEWVKQNPKQADEEK